MSFWEITMELLRGFQTTLGLFFLTLLFALPLGLVFAFVARSRILPLRFLMRAFIYIIRGTPLLLQLMIVIYLPGIALGNPITRWAIFGGSVEKAYFYGTVFAFILNYACYFAEIYRGGIENIPRGQYEAGQVLGMTKSQVFFRIILLQVIKSILAPISNEVITLVKDTSLARTVAVAEVLFMADRILSLHFLIWPLFYTGAFYLIFNTVLTLLFAYAEKKLSRYRLA